MDEQKVLTVNQVAARLQVNVQTVRRWLREGDLVGTPLGGRSGWRVSEAELQGFLDRRRLAASETGSRGVRDPR